MQHANARTMWRRAFQLVVIYMVAIQLASGQQWSCRYPPGHPLYPQAWDGLKMGRYNAYIPGDNIVGGSPCYRWIGGMQWPFSMRYKADGYPVIDYYAVAPARAHHTQFFQNNANARAGRRRE
jgi:hypothetical protein